jgi:uncharacterized membrane protein
MAADTEGFFSHVTTVASGVIGSWWMIVAQTIAISAWFWLNLSHNSPTGRFDNERFDTLRLLLGFQSVYTAPLILMAQRRVGARDRKVFNEVNEFERQAMELRWRAEERRIRLEEKIDRLLAERDKG